MKRIQVPSIAYAERFTPLNGIVYKFVFRFNEIAGRWKLDIYDNEKNLLKAGITLLEDFDLTSHITNLDVTEGFLFTFKAKDNGSDTTGRDNIGLDRTHELVYNTFSETSE